MVLVEVLKKVTSTILKYDKNIYYIKDMNALGIGRKDLLNYFLYQFGPETTYATNRKHL